MSRDVSGELFRELARALPTSMDDDDLRRLAARLRPHLDDEVLESSDSKLLTAAEVAEYAHVHVETVRRAIRAGRLPVAARIGRSPRLTSLAVQSWLGTTFETGIPARQGRRQRSSPVRRTTAAYSLRAALDG
jgi:excisionase family DNA binding protein